MTRFYGFSYRELMAMPIRMFWIYAREQQRVRSQELLDQLHVSNAAQGGEHAQDLAKGLSEAVGTPIVPDVVTDDLDRDGLEELRRIALNG